MTSNRRIGTGIVTKTTLDIERTPLNTARYISTHIATVQPNTSHETFQSDSSIAGASFKTSLKK